MYMHAHLSVAVPAIKNGDALLPRPNGLLVYSSLISPPSSLEATHYTSLKNSAVNEVRRFHC